MDQNSQEKEEGSSRIHRPEFVLLDKEQPKENERGGNEYFQALNMLQGIKPSLGLQLVILFAVFLIFLATVISIFFFLINVLISLLVLFSNDNVNKYVLQSWKNVKKLCVFLVGTIIGLFSPSLGIGLIVLYLMKEKEPLNKSVLSRLFKSNAAN